MSVAYSQLDVFFPFGPGQPGCQCVDSFPGDSPALSTFSMFGACFSMFSSEARLILGYQHTSRVTQVSWITVFMADAGHRLLCL